MKSNQKFPFEHCFLSPMQELVAYLLVREILSTVFFQTLDRFSFTLYIHGTPQVLFMMEGKPSFLFIYLFMVVQGLHCCTGFSSCGGRGPLSSCSAWVSHCGGFSRYGVRAVDTRAPSLWCTGLAALRHVGSSQTRGQTHVPSTGRQIRIHWTTREVPSFFFFPPYGHQVISVIFVFF